MGLIQKISDWYNTRLFAKAIMTGAAMATAGNVQAKALEQVAAKPKTVHAAPKQKIVGNMDLLSYHGKPYSELWMMKKFPKSNVEFYAETTGDLEGLYSELLVYGNGLAPWLEYVNITNAPDFFRGGMMWSGKIGNDSLMLRIGRSEDNDLTYRLIFNESKGMVGLMINSNNPGHIHAEIPRLYFELDDKCGLYIEATHDRNDEKTEHGVRGGIRIKF